MEGVKSHVTIAVVVQIKAVWFIGQRNKYLDQVKVKDQLNHHKTRILVEGSVSFIDFFLYDCYWCYS